MNHLNTKKIPEIVVARLDRRHPTTGRIVTIEFFFTDKKNIVSTSFIFESDFFPAIDVLPLTTLSSLRPFCSRHSQQPEILFRLRLVIFLSLTSSFSLHRLLGFPVVLDVFFRASPSDWLLFRWRAFGKSGRSSRCVVEYDRVVSTAFFINLFCPSRAIGYVSRSISFPSTNSLPPWWYLPNSWSVRVQTRLLANTSLVVVTEVKQYRIRSVRSIWPRNDRNFGNIRRGRRSWRKTRSETNSTSSYSLRDSVSRNFSSLEDILVQISRK